MKLSQNRNRRARGAAFPPDSGKPDTPKKRDREDAVPSSCGPTPAAMRTPDQNDQRIPSFARHRELIGWVSKIGLSAGSVASSNRL